jgi:hypothetical protein
VDFLHGQLKVDFDTVIRYATLLRDTPAYETFDKLIREQFNNVDSTADSTIGLSLAGCLISEKYGNNPCSPGCLGNIPTKNTISCDETVIVAIPQNNGYFFLTKNIGKKEYARLYLSEYKGFSAEEKAFLKQNGITAVILADFQEKPIYVNGSNIYYVGELPERQNIPTILFEENSTPSSDTGILYLIFIVILALVIAISVILYNKYQRNK